MFSLLVWFHCLPCTISGLLDAPQEHPGWELEVNGFNFMANLGLVLPSLGGCWFILHSTVTAVISSKYAESLPTVHRTSGSSAGPQSGSVGVNIKYVRWQHLGFLCRRKQLLLPITGWFLKTIRGVLDAWVREYCEGWQRCLAGPREAVWLCPSCEGLEGDVCLCVCVVGRDGVVVCEQEPGDASWP